MQFTDNLGFGRAHLKATITRPKHWLGAEPAYLNDAGELVAGRRWVYSLEAKCQIPDPRDVTVVDEWEQDNLVTNAGRDFLHLQGYQTTGLGTNGLNFIALTNTAITPAVGDTTLSGEIVTNGLSRAQGTVAHTGGTNTTTVAHTFTCATAAQACQGCALFTASSAGTMNHEFSFTQRSLQVADTITTTHSISLG